MMFSWLGRYFLLGTGSKGSPISSVSKVADRFFHAFQDHGIGATEIPLYLTTIRLSDLSSSEKLLEAVTNDILEEVAKLFGIRIQWLLGLDDQVYDYSYPYIGPRGVLDHIASLRQIELPIPSLKAPLRVLTTEKKLDRNSDSNPNLFLVLVEPIPGASSSSVVRYHPYLHTFDWTNDQDRLELKAITRLVATKLRTVVPLYEVSDPAMDDAIEGILRPRSLMRPSVVTSPSLEDYVEGPAESGVYKEFDELPRVLEYIEAEGLGDYAFAPPPVPQASSAGPVLGKETPTRRRRGSINWEPMLATATAWWGQEPNLPIAEMARRLKRTKLDGCHCEVETIEKSLRPVAPVGVAGKPGRKATKSTSIVKDTMKQLHKP